MESTYFQIVQHDKVTVAKMGSTRSLATVDVLAMGYELAEYVVNAQPRNLVVDFSSVDSQGIRGGVVDYYACEERCLTMAANSYSRGWSRRSEKPFTSCALIAASSEFLILSTMRLTYLARNAVNKESQADICQNGNGIRGLDVRLFRLRAAKRWLERGPERGRFATVRTAGPTGVRFRRSGAP